MQGTRTTRINSRGYCVLITTAILLIVGFIMAPVGYSNIINGCKCDLTQSSDCELLNDAWGVHTLKDTACVLDNMIVLAIGIILTIAGLISACCACCMLGSGGNGYAIALFSLTCCLSAGRQLNKFTLPCCPIRTVYLRTW